uniref:Venom peptide U18-SYTX-Sth1a n=1 Tax=Scytodes thoracica TaxID=1112478 RepID=A0A0A0VA77_SCYTH|nr:venom peptide U18-SYTX-Sth1a [Scytodes thoracica]
MKTAVAFALCVFLFGFLIEVEGKRVKPGCPLRCDRKKCPVISCECGMKLDECKCCPECYLCRGQYDCSESRPCDPKRRCEWDYRWGRTHCV